METLFRNQKRGKQLIDFAGLKYSGNRYGTDVDCLLEFQDKLFIFVEIKGKGATMPVGQRLALDRITDRLASTGVTACTLLAEHNTPDPNVNIDLSQCNVVSYRWNKQWKAPEVPMNVKQAADILLDYCNIKK